MALECKPLTIRARRWEVGGGVGISDWQMRTLACEWLKPKRLAGEAFARMESTWEPPSPLQDRKLVQSLWKPIWQDFLKFNLHSHPVCLSSNPTSRYFPKRIECIKIYIQECTSWCWLLCLLPRNYPSMGEEQIWGNMYLWILLNYYYSQ